MNASCSECKIKKPFKEFYKNSRKKNGLESSCKECVLKKKRNQYNKRQKLKQKVGKYRDHKSIRVLNIPDCTVTTLFIKRPKVINNVEMEEVVEDLLCQVGEKEKLKDYLT